jgi:hypothetical protein
MHMSREVTVMMRRFPFLLGSLILASCAQAPMPEYPAIRDAVYAPGQVWSISAPAAQSRATLTVLRIDSVPQLGTVIHVRLDSLDLSHAGKGLERQHTVQHLPFIRSAIDSSVVSKLIDSGAVPEYREGYTQWRRAQGGAFSITVAAFLQQLAATNTGRTM